MMVFCVRVININSSPFRKSFATEIAEKKEFLKAFSQKSLRALWLYCTHLYKRSIVKNKESQPAQVQENKQ